MRSFAVCGLAGSSNELQMHKGHRAITHRETTSDGRVQLMWALRAPFTGLGHAGPSFTTGAMRMAYSNPVHGVSRCLRLSHWNRWSSSSGLGKPRERGLNAIGRRSTRRKRRAYRVKPRERGWMIPIVHRVVDRR